jgi:peptidyl-tRNA hydrolase, PTH2 family
MYFIVVAVVVLVFVKGFIYRSHASNAKPKTETCMVQNSKSVFIKLSGSNNKRPIATTMMMLPSNDTVKAFVAGALLPTIATIWLWKRQREYDLAAGYSSEEEEDEDDAAGDNATTSPDSTNTNNSQKWGITHAPYKMILAVNTDLAMGKGKIAAQCGHAAVGCYRVAHRRIPHAVQAWNMTGCAKIAVKCPEREYDTIMELCTKRGIPYYLVEDAGRTQIAAGSKTVLALLAPVSVLSTVTDHLKLL